MGAQSSSPVEQIKMRFEEIIEKRIANCETLEDLGLILGNLLTHHSVWEDGRLLSIRQLVDYVAGLRIEIYAAEHPPPHFHVKAQGIEAVFSINDGSFVRGIIGARERKLIGWWYNRSRAHLIRIWNQTRPTDCPVGPIKE